MPPKVTYWTGTWDPAKEAISKEINALRVGSRAHAPVVSFSPGQRSRLAWRDRALLLSGTAWPVLRAVAAVLEPRGQVTHVFGGQISWHLFRALGRRPILLTAVAAGNSSGPLPLGGVARVAVETEASIEEWLRAGIPRDRIEIVRPGIDLDWFRPTPGPVPERFTLLFASTPSDPAELAARGIPLLVDLARRSPDIDILLPWRQWGDVGAARRALDALRPPRNLIVRYRDETDMRDVYARVHATVACFSAGAGKTCPNFVLEGFAAGRPCLSTTDGGLASLIAETGAGAVATRDAESLAAGVDRLRAAWPACAERARRLAEDHFDLRRFRACYDQLYRDIASERSHPGERGT